jgi:hypothetical protein
MSDGKPLKFAPFTTVISASFWTTLSRKKLTELKLDEPELPIWGHYDAGTVGRSPRFHIDQEGLIADGEYNSATLGARMEGVLKLFNTAEQFEAVDKSRMLAEIKVKVTRQYFWQFIR